MLDNYETPRVMRDAMQLKACFGIAKMAATHQELVQLEKVPSFVDSVSTKTSRARIF